MIRRMKRSSRSARGCLCELHRGVLSPSLFPSRSTGTCSFLVQGIFVSPWMIGFGLPHLHDAHDSASLATACSPSTARLMDILMHLIQARHRFTASCEASRRCAPQEEITSTSTCSRSATAGVTNSSRARLRAPSALSVPHLATRVPTCSSSSPSSPLLPPGLHSSFTAT